MTILGSTLQSQSGAAHMALGLAVVIFVGTIALIVGFLLTQRETAVTNVLDFAEKALREDSAVWGADRALRALRTSSDRAGVRCPSIVRCTMDLGWVRVDLAVPTVAPPSPWTSSADGRVWSAPMASIQALALDLPPTDEFAAMVAVGTTESGVVLLDLCRAAGPIEVHGERRVVSAVLNRFIGQLATDPWSAECTILAVGLVLEMVQGRSVSVAEALEVLRADATPGVIFFRRQPRGEERVQLDALLNAPGNRWGVVVAEKTDRAKWSFAVEDDGRLDAGVLGVMRWADIGRSQQADSALFPSDGGSS